MSGVRCALPCKYQPCVELECQRLSAADDNESAIDDNSFWLMSAYAGIGMAMHAIDGNWLHANQFFCQMLDYSEAELRQLTYQHISHPADLLMANEQVAKLTAGDIPCIQLEQRYRHRHGHYIWVKLTTTLVRDKNRQPLYFASQMENIEQRKKAEQQISLLSFALNRVSEAAFLIDEQGCFNYVNAQACSDLGYSREELLSGMGVTDIDPDYHTAVWREHWSLLKQNGSLLFESVHQTKTAGRYPVEINANYIEFDGQGYSFALVRVITERKRQEAYIEHLAYHDAVTQLPNRTQVLKRLKSAISQVHGHQQLLAVLFLDLDRFKTINDTLGHLAGDELLRQVSDRWAKVLGEHDFLGRFGGDEFIILLPNLAVAEDAADVVGKLLGVLATPFQIAKREIHVSTSVGISMYPRDTDNAESLLKYADTALYMAKEQGRNTFRFFSPELDIQVHQRLSLENDLRSALDRNQLYLVYQPIIDVPSERCVGVEALLRWQHPEHGLISPADFIPVAEDTGQIIPIGEWVLRTACRQLRAWLDRGLTDFRVAVNLSRRQLEHAQLANTLQQILNETGCPAHCLELEITESATMGHPEEAIVRLNVLHAMDIRLALDDYGTGYSSLAYLKRFPLDRLKIDRSFVKSIPADKDDLTIVQTTIVMARQLGLKVVAEGVETEAQRDFLQSCRCDEIQGYLYGKPMSAAQLAQYCGF